MITITNNKVAGFEPCWKRFPGFSVLFDNPGDSLTREGDLHWINCAPSAGGPLDLYYNINRSLAGLDRGLMIRAYLFCPLPPYSYHVTVWDGINVDNIGSVLPAVRADWSTFLDELPLSFTSSPGSMSAVTSHSLRRWSGSISFEFDTLTLWGNQVLVARLRPLKGESEQQLADLTRHRAQLSEVAAGAFGPIFCPGPNTPPYSPHISLGYFANQEHAQHAHAQIDRWTERFRETLRGSTVTYTCVDVYGFTDMASFFKV